MVRDAPQTPFDPATTDLVYTVTDRAVAHGGHLQCTVVANASRVEISVDLFGTARAEASEPIDPETWQELLIKATELMEGSHDDAAAKPASAACTSQLAIRSDGRTAFSVTASADEGTDGELHRALRTFIDPAIAHVDLPDS